MTILFSLLCTVMWSQDMIARESRLYYGVQVKEGINWLFCQSTSEYYKSITGRRYHPYFSAFVDIGTWYRSRDSFSGFTLEVQKSYRGGEITNNLIEAPAEVFLDYCGLRAGYTNRTNGEGFMRAGLEVSFLQAATYSDARLSSPFDITQEVARRTLGFWFEGGGRIGKHLTMSLFAEWTFMGLSDESEDMLIENFWEIPTDDHNLTVGITLGWLFNPVVLSSKRNKK